jgi:hypothetical protein
MSDTHTHPAMHTWGWGDSLGFFSPNLDSFVVPTKDQVEVGHGCSLVKFLIVEVLTGGRESRMCCLSGKMSLDLRLCTSGCGNNGAMGALLESPVGRGAVKKSEFLLLPASNRYSCPMGWREVVVTTQATTPRPGSPGKPHNWQCPRSSEGRLPIPWFLWMALSAFLCVITPLPYYTVLSGGLCQSFH